MAKTLVTGAAGFIGCHVVRLLLDEGREVRAMLAPGEPDDNLQGLDVEMVTGDIRDRDAMDRHTKGCDTVYHLAAIYKLWMPDPNVIYDVNINGTEVVMEAALRHDVEKVVYTSTIAAIGIADGDALSNEETPFNQWKCGNDYVLSKYMAQRLTENMARNRDLPVVLVNPSFPYGERDRVPTPTGHVIIQVARQAFPAFIPGGINVVDVEDVALGHVLAEKKGRIGERYLLTNTNISNRDFMRTAAEIAGASPPKITIPAKPAVAVGHVAEFVADHITHRPPFMTAGGITYGSQHLYFDNTKTQKELGLTFRPFRESLERAIHWFGANGYIRKPS